MVVTNASEGAQETQEKLPLYMLTTPEGGYDPKGIERFRADHLAAVSGEARELATCMKGHREDAARLGFPIDVETENRERAKYELIVKVTEDLETATPEDRARVAEILRTDWEPKLAASIKGTEDSLLQGGYDYQDFWNGLGAAQYEQAKQQRSDVMATVNRLVSIG